MSLLDVQHQPQALQQVQRALLRDRIPHAYIFHGPEGVGKELLARGMAQLLLCASPVKRRLEGAEATKTGLSEITVGCGQCEDCQTVRAGTHPDLHLVYRQLNREHSDPAVRKRKGLELGVDVVREFLIDKVARTPLRGRAKVFIIREADVLNVEAQNALLKTLEEPPGATYLFLLAAALDELLPTTQSRCQVVRFQGLPTLFIEQKLREIRPDVSPQHAAWYAAQSDGSIGLAVQSVDDGLLDVAGRLNEVMSRSARNGAGELIKFFTEESKLLGEKFAERDAEITDTESARRGLKTLFRLASAYFAARLRSGAKQSKASGVFNGGSLELDAGHVERLATAERQLDLNANVSLVIEVLAHELLPIRARVT